LAFKI